MEISVITTVYNIEKYIGKCIESILNQTFTDFELILINDCSTDSSLDIIKHYMEKDNRIKLINNEINLGCGMCRFIGINEAKCDYIAFIDGDDYVSENYLKRLYNTSKTYDSDITVCHSKIFVEFEDDNIYGYTEHKKDLSEYNFSKEISIFETDDEKLNAYKSKALPYLNNKLIKKKLFDKVEYCKRVYSEDMQTYFKLLYFSNKMVSMDDDNETYYFYRKHGSSLTLSYNIDKQVFFFALCALDIYEFIIYEYPNETFQKFYNKFYLRNYVNRFFKGNYIDKEKIKKQYPQYYKELEERWDKIKVTLDCY